MKDEGLSVVMKQNKFNRKNNKQFLVLCNGILYIHERVAHALKIRIAEMIPNQIVFKYGKVIRFLIRLKISLNKTKFVLATKK